ncbi:unnamed protein product [Brassicogethes aeneus]|uniref:Beta-1,3-glucan-binding protein n=1 Tax=Brassicogethes aeneus TaxID=1431903 RepID=A0A9P0FBU7_BRAAE|nr:unnamed protein product [Brassicogethes aeneus]
MKWSMKKTILPILTFVIAIVSGQYEVPDATVEVYSPRGLKVSIPDEEGVKLFAFHGKINEEMNGREGGTFSRDILKPKDGKWTFYDPTAKLNIGDKLYYWTYVDFFDGERKLGYPKDDQFHEVKEFQVKPGECKQSQTTQNGKSDKICSGKLIFEEHFKTFNPALWSPEVKFADAPDYEFVIYGNYSETMKFTNDKLGIKPTLAEDVYGRDIVFSSLDLGASCTDKSSPCYRKAQGQFIVPPVISSQINTKDKFSFKYGKIEVRAKLPKGNWIYPEIFLNPATEEYGADYLSGQIRVAFATGNMPTKLQGGVIFSENEKGRSYGIKTKKNHKRTVHNYGVTWTPDKITFTLDNEAYGEVIPPNDGFAGITGILPNKYKEIWEEGSKIAPFDQEMYFTIGVGVGGHNFPDSDNTKPWKNSNATQARDFYQNLTTWYETWTPQSTLEVDHIKVWAL